MPADIRLAYMSLEEDMKKAGLKRRGVAKVSVMLGVSRTVNIYKWNDYSLSFFDHSGVLVGVHILAFKLMLLFSVFTFLCRNDHLFSATPFYSHLQDILKHFSLTSQKLIDII